MRTAVGELDVRTRSWPVATAILKKVGGGNLVSCTHHNTASDQGGIGEGQLWRSLAEVWFSQLRLDHACDQHVMQVKAALYFGVL